jgi:formamidopyrimidine-DNA glycosylase
MPELPEVETIVRGLDPLVRGRRIETVWWSGLPLHLARKVDLRGLRAVAVDGTIAGVRRLGKYIIVEIDRARDHGVVIHLGMTGRLRVEPAARTRAPHTHVVFGLAGGDQLRFVDARRFGWVAPGRPLAQVEALAELGPDALLGFDVPRFAEALGGVRAPIKAFLLDQRRIAGIGNIYASEALFRAGIHPATPAGRLRRQAPALLEAVRAVLTGAISRRGTTLRDYVDADGRRGENAGALLVYGRSSQPCSRCGTAIRKRVDAGRSTFFCTICQPRRRRPSHEGRAI